MSKKVITDYNTIERVAFEMALALAIKQDSIKTPEHLMSTVEMLYPECYEVAKKQKRKEAELPPSKDFQIGGW